VHPRLLVVRNLMYRMFVELGCAPSIEEVAGAADLSSVEVEAVWRELHRAHALVVNPATNVIRMANPFSAVPTAYRVQAAGRWWYGNCAWDALGICAALRTDGPSRPPARTVVRRSRSTYAPGGPMTSASCSIAWFPPRTGGTTSSSPEAR
jgi:Alkylmercury lyase